MNFLWNQAKGQKSNLNYLHSWNVPKRKDLKMKYISGLNFKGMEKKDQPLLKPSPFFDRADGMYSACLVIRPEEDISITLFARIGLDDYPACMWLEREIEIPNKVTVSKLRNFSRQPEIAALCLRMLAGYRQSWDGRNHYGEWSSEAEREFGDLKRIVANVFY
jgi:hypothetical protein